MIFSGIILVSLSQVYQGWQLGFCIKMRVITQNSDETVENFWLGRFVIEVQRV